MGTELPTKVMLGQTLVLMQITFLNNVRKVGRLILSCTSCCLILFVNKNLKNSYAGDAENVHHLLEDNHPHF
jgi:hypothetical protein